MLIKGVPGAHKWSWHVVRRLVFKMVQEATTVIWVFLRTKIEFLVTCCGVLMLFQMFQSHKRLLTSWEITKELLFIVFQDVILQWTVFMEAKTATWNSTSKGKTFIMNLHMVLQGIWSFEALATSRIFTGKWSLFSVDNDVSFHIRFKSKDLFAFFCEALVGFFAIFDDFLIQRTVRVWRVGDLRLFKAKRFVEGEVFHIWKCLGKQEIFTVKKQNINFEWER